MDWGVFLPYRCSEGPATNAAVDDRRLRVSSARVLSIDRLDLEGVDGDPHKAIADGDAFWATVHADLNDAVRLRVNA